MWIERNVEHPNYRRIDYVYRQHHARFARYVDAHGLVCQDCGGRGGERDVILDDGTGPWESCGWCEGTGRVTRWLRALWLRCKHEEKRKREVARTVHAVARGVGGSTA